MHRQDNKPIVQSLYHVSKAMRTLRAFTLVELLVVIGIIGLLVGILLPTLSRARAASNRTACAAQLRDIGHAFTMYMNDSRNKLPRVNTMPSMVPPPADNPPSAVQVLQPYIKGATNVWRCPADIIRKPLSSQKTENSQEICTQLMKQITSKAIFDPHHLDW